MQLLAHECCVPRKNHEVLYRTHNHNHNATTTNSLTENGSEGYGEARQAGSEVGTGGVDPVRGGALRVREVERDEGVAGGSVERLADAEDDPGHLTSAGAQGGGRANKP